MKKIARFALYVKERYDFLARKRYSTLAGTFVYFLVMSVMPFAVWLTILFGRANLPIERVLEMPVFSSVEKIFSYIRTEAEEARKGASAILIGTTLYSTTGFFYHLRRGGEILYGYTMKKSGWKVRISALLFSLSVMTATALIVTAYAGGAFLFSRVFSGIALRVLNYVWLLIFSFFLVLMLNAYACPYKTHFRVIWKGTCFTVAAWAAALVWFSVFLKFGRTDRLYGAISTVIVFLLWLYVLMMCFAAGVAFNSEAFEKRNAGKEEKTL